LDNTQEAIWLEKMLNHSNMATSYKAYWLKGIIEEVIEESQIITFDRLINRMIVNAWYPIIQYKLSFGIQDKLCHVIRYLNSTYDLGADIKKSKLLEFLTDLEDPIFKKKAKNFRNMVPYRLLSPFFREKTVGIKDQKKNRMITELAFESEICFYKIDPRNRNILVKDTWAEYIKNNHALIKGWLQYKLVIYLQIRNPNVPGIPMKLDPPDRRSLSKATTYWKQVMQHHSIKDIYTSSYLDDDNFKEFGALSIDHFIPWSFVLHDEMWNLTPTFKSVNSSKSDKLPSLNKYLDAFTHLQYDAYSVMKNSTHNQKVLEDYISIGYTPDIEDLFLNGHQIDQSTFKDSLKKTIKPIYQIAYNQGFEVWKI